MKLGDLVKPGECHGLRNESFRSIGIILERHEANSNFNAHVTVIWNDGNVEAEWPDYLEVLGEAI